MAIAAGGAAPGRRRAGALGALLLVAGLVACTGSCVRLNWSRQTVQQPIHEGRLALLVPGDGLGRCLEVLGAPLWVGELGGGAMTLAYGWLEESGWGANVSAPLGDNFSASFDYDRLDRRAQGLLLVLDADQRLVVARRGALRDLLAESPGRQPAFDARWLEDAGGH
jgi:hypothetical protein